MPHPKPQFVQAGGRNITQVFENYHDEMDDGGKLVSDHMQLYAARASTSRWFYFFDIALPWGFTKYPG